MNAVSASGKLILPLFFALILIACDELKPKTDTVLAKKEEQTSYFYQLEDYDLTLTKEKAVYIPVYSEIFVSGGGKMNMAITLSIRNTDFKSPLVVNNVNYYNTAGKLIENYLQNPYLLEPMASTHFFVNQTDTRGGVGGNFIVQWAANKLVNEPVIEAVMAGSTGTQGMSFISPGREIARKQAPEDTEGH